MAVLLPFDGRDQLCGTVAGQRWEVSAVYLFEFKVNILLISALEFDTWDWKLRLLEVVQERKAQW